MAALTMTQRTPSNTQLAYKPPSPGGPVLGAPITSPAYADGDLQRFMRSQLAKLGKSYAAPAAAPKMLHVGINYSEDSPMSLSRCINDATIFAWMAQSVYGRRADEALFLTDMPGTAMSLRPTHMNILAALRKMAFNARPGETLLVTYSGHGLDAAHDPKLPAKPLMVPVDWLTNGCVTDRDISREMLCRLPAGCRVVFISDYAHSGPCMELAHNITAAPATPAKPSTPSQRPASAGAAPRGGIVREWSGQQQVEPCEAELIAIIGSSAGRNAAGLAGCSGLESVPGGAFTRLMYNAIVAAKGVTSPKALFDSVLAHAQSTGLQLHATLSASHPSLLTSASLALNAVPRHDPPAGWAMGQNPVLTATAAATCKLSASNETYQPYSYTHSQPGAGSPTPAGTVFGTGTLPGGGTGSRSWNATNWSTLRSGPGDLHVPGTMTSLQLAIANHRQRPQSAHPAVYRPLPGTQRGTQAAWNSAGSITADLDSRLPADRHSLSDSSKVLSSTHYAPSARAREAWQPSDDALLAADGTINRAGTQKSVSFAGLGGGAGSLGGSGGRPGTGIYNMHGTQQGVTNQNSAFRLTGYAIDGYGTTAEGFGKSGQNHYKVGQAYYHHKY